MLNLNDMKVKELKEMAKELKVKDWWNLKKEELITEIAFAIADKEEEAEDASGDVEDVNDEVIKDDEKVAQNEPEKPKRKQDLIEYNGKTQNLSKWAKELGIPGQTLYARIHISNWSVEKAFTTPARRKKEEA